MAIKEIVYKDKKFIISYEIINPKIKDTILILHGWGANKELMKNYFSPLFLRQIYIDLCGFGKSSTPEFALNSNDYANIIKEFMKNYEFDTIMGHSFGGKVATLLNPKNLILLSSAGILEPKSYDVRLKIFLAKIAKKLKISNLSFLVSKDGDNLEPMMYETFKNVVNEDFTNEFLKLSSNTLIFWGKDDKAVSIKSGERIHTLIKNSKFIPLDGDHFFFMAHSKFIIDEIQKFIKANKC